MINLAKSSGTWDALNTVDALEDPHDLKAALVTVPNAKAHWEKFPPSTKRGILEWILNAKTSPTREKRIRETVTLAEQNIRGNSYPKPKI